MDDPSVLLSISGHIARIELNNPEQHNALGVADIALFRQHLADITANPAIRVLLVTGRGDRSFCAGASLKQFQSGDMSGDVFAGLTDQLGSLMIPSICALNGNVYGGGAEIALCCDYRIGVAGMRLLVPAARIGICYPLNGMRRYVDKLGLDAAKRILVVSEELSVDDLMRIGFLHQVVEAPALAETARTIAAHLAGLAPLAVSSMKRVLIDIARGTVDEDAARKFAEQCASSGDLKEGLAAQRERRPPRFTGS